MAWNMDLSTAIHNEQDQVALIHYLTNDPVIMVNDSVGYKFVTHQNICLAWVNLEHAQRMLDLKGGCNCPNSIKKPIIRVASQVDVDRWSGLQ